MFIIYILLIALAAFPLVITIIRIRRQRNIKQNGIRTIARITGITGVRMYKSSAIDRLSLQYKNIITDEVYYTTSYAKQGKHKVGDSVPVTYMQGKPQKIVMEGGATHWPALGFGILLLLFVVFAVFKIHEIVETGYAI